MHYFLFFVYVDSDQISNETLFLQYLKQPAQKTQKYMLRK